MNKKSLPTTTLVCVDCINYGEALTAIRKSMFQVDFARAVFFTDIKAYNPNFPFEIIKIDKISSKEEFSHFIFKKLASYITTEHVIIIHADGYIIDGNAWDDEFYKYDYIGSPWLYPEGRNVGNGVSFRTKKLLDILASDDFMDVTHPEDDAICRLYGAYLEKKYDIKFAPTELADKFGFELREPMQPTFLFHGKFHQPYKKTIVVKRDGALGDIIATEPLLEYYHNKGYNVAIDMPIHLCMFFGTHFYPIKHITQLDGRIKPEIIDLNNSYEKNPKQLHLKSYYETAGITDGAIKNPRLKFPINEHNKLFKKYVVLHIDKRDQPGRNIYGVDFIEVVRELNNKGYSVIQVGQYEHEEVYGAIQMKTQTTTLLLYLVAGADGFIGIDSGVSNMAVAMNRPSVIFSGSVNPEYIYPDLSNVEIVTKGKVCDVQHCWHEVISTTGQDCYIDKEAPPCTQYTTQMAIDALNKIL
jgi:ADP-heptose:LPS heptosyltransferase